MPTNRQRENFIDKMSSEIDKKCGTVDELQGEVEELVRRRYNYAKRHKLEIPDDHVLADYVPREARRD